MSIAQYVWRLLLSSSGHSVCGKLSHLFVLRGLFVHLPAAGCATCYPLGRSTTVDSQGLKGFGTITTTISTPARKAKRGLLVRLRWESSQSFFVQPALRHCDGNSWRSRHIGALASHSAGISMNSWTKETALLALTSNAVVDDHHPGRGSRRMSEVVSAPSRRP